MCVLSFIPIVFPSYNHSNVFNVYRLVLCVLVKFLLSCEHIIYVYIILLYWPWFVSSIPLAMLTCCFYLLHDAPRNNPTHIGVTNYPGLPKTEGPPETQTSKAQSGKVLVKPGWDGHRTHWTYSHPQWGTPSLPPAPHHQKRGDSSYACPLRICVIDTLNLTRHCHAMVYTPTASACGFLFPTSWCYSAFWCSPV